MRSHGYLIVFITLFVVLFGALADEQSQSKRGTTDDPNLVDHVQQSWDKGNAPPGDPYNGYKVSWKQFGKCTAVAIATDTDSKTPQKPQIHWAGRTATTADLGLYFNGEKKPREISYQPAHPSDWLDLPSGKLTMIRVTLWDGKRFICAENFDLRKSGK
jgi:hypothetical protein